MGASRTELGSGGSGIDAPTTAALPKGGGAIGAVGERLEVAVASGTAGFNIPIGTPTGRSGFGPALALRYDSGLGLGAFGLGWELSHSSIARSTIRGVPRYRDDDVVVLGGAEELVLLPESSRSTETELVDRFRPRVEGGFAKIERFRPLDGGAASWSVRTRDNVLHTYGSIADARIANPAAPNQVFEWLLERSEDDRGNIATYEYIGEDLRGAEAGHPEAEREVGGHRYLKRILYGNREMGQRRDFCFEIVFDYGDHDIDQPTPVADRAWPMRMDPFSRGKCGFELRLRRLCRRVLVFHRFPELGNDAVLVQSDEFLYDERKRGTRLVGVARQAWNRNAGVAYRAAPLPPLSFEYTEPVLDPRVEELPQASRDSLLHGIARSGAHWIDLHGEGLPGVLTLDRGDCRYAANLGDGRFAASEVVAELPTLIGAGGAFLDLDGDGQLDLLQERPTAGVFARAIDGKWQPYRELAQAPNTGGGKLRLVDLTGDGLPDLVEWRGASLLWHRARGLDGYAEVEECVFSSHEAESPLVDFDDPRHAVLFADMTGDGLLDVVRVSAGAVVYWPNFGHGRFGAQITMSNAPQFGVDFDPRRLHIADLDGTGPSDLVYVDGTGARAYFNQCGNGWTDATTLGAVTSNAAISVVDLLGDGTCCLVWEPQHVDASIHYCRLFRDGKPNLLCRIDNHSGAETRLEYAPSTRFYLDDKAAGRPWLTRIPFPVHLVVRVTRLDHVAGTSFSSSYRYRHGAFDPIERELRGFGFVEQRDAEALGPEAMPYDTAPVVTKSWFHTGLSPADGATSRSFVNEYWRGDAQAFALAETRLPEQLAADEVRDACRALRGALLRREVFADDGAPESAHPFAVTETVFAVRRIQARDKECPGVFFGWESERIETTYERDPSDPRIAHAVVLDIDALGSIRRSAKIAYPRRLPDGVEQTMGVALLAETDVTHDVESLDRNRVGVVIASRSFHLEGLPVTPWAPLGAEVLRSWPSRTMLAHERFLYWADDLSGPLSHGDVGVRAMPHQCHSLVMTLADVAAFEGRVEEALLREGGYHQVDATGQPLPSGWWSTSGLVIPDPTRFYLPREQRDRFGNVYRTTYDAHGLFVIATVDPLGNTARVQIDYRTLQPWWIEDANGNRSCVAFDDRGVVVRSALLGKDPAIDPTQRGDTLDDPTERFEYDLLAWSEGRGPVRVRSLRRERHADPQSPWHESIAFYDGRGRSLLAKIDAEPGPGGVARWVGTGRVVINNKGLPVKQYQPYFSATPDYESEAALRERGVASTVTYDALGRAVRIDHPDGTSTRSEVATWTSRSFDRGDTVGGSRWLTERIARGGADERAARDSERYDGTPAVAHVDSQGRVFRAVQDNGAAGMLTTKTVYDVRGRPLAVIDPRGVAAAQTSFDFSGRPIRRWSNDSGERWVFGAVDGAILRAWDGRGTVTRSEYDVLRRPTTIWTNEIVTERLEYGEPAAGDAVGDQAAKRDGRRGRLWRHWDEAGMHEARRFDFQGLPLESMRRLARVSLETMTAAVVTDATLEPEEYVERFTYDALGRPTKVALSDGTVLSSQYNHAGFLSSIVGDIVGLGSTRFVDAIDYDASGRRERIRYGNGVETTYSYDPLNFRMIQARSTRSDGSVLQDTHYVFDVIGNVSEVRDEADATQFYDGQEVPASLRCRYDAIYRLIEAQGREHESVDQPSGQDIDANDWQRVRRYTETYQYDAVGNFLSFAHRYVRNGTPQGWTRRYQYEGEHNRLMASSVAGDGPSEFSARYRYDAHGNVTSMPHMPVIEWTTGDRMRRAELAGGGDVHFYYCASGERVRKVRRHLNGLIEERIYLGAIEIFRRRRGDRVELERRTLRVFDDQGAVALVEVRTIDSADPNGVGAPALRFQLADRNGSTTMELDERAQLISREEFHPFGTTALRLARGQAEVSAKRYRYNGAEHDEETGCYHLGAREYAPWLARFTSADPAGMIDGANLYAYSRNNPVTLIDLSGYGGGPTPAQRRIWRTFEKAVDSLIRATKTELAKISSQVHLAFDDAGKRLRTIVDTLEELPGVKATRFDAKSSATAPQTGNQVKSNKTPDFEKRSSGPTQGDKIQADPIREVRPNDIADVTVERLDKKQVPTDVGELPRTTKELQPAMKDLDAWHNATGQRTGMPRRAPVTGHAPAPATMPAPLEAPVARLGGLRAGLGRVLQGAGYAVMAVGVTEGLVNAHDRIETVQGAGYSIDTETKIGMIAEEIILGATGLGITGERLIVSDAELAMHLRQEMRDRGYDFNGACRAFMPACDPSVTSIYVGEHIIARYNEEVVESPADGYVVESGPDVEVIDGGPNDPCASTTETFDPGPLAPWPR